jgi:hypothetical protein
VDFERVRERMISEGFKSLYHNSGAFGFARGTDVHYSGWIGPPDASIREEMRPHLRHVPPPYEANLARAAGGVWTSRLPGVAWVMPMSHWSYELEFGNTEWMPAALDAIGVDGGELSHRANGSAVEFDVRECSAMESLVAALLANLRTSDFMLAFPGRPALCTVHHHKQLWWQTTDPALHAALMTVGSSNA